MARRTTAAEKAEMDREMAKIAAVAKPARKEPAFFSSPEEAAAFVQANYGTRKKTMTELAAEYEEAHEQCKLFEANAIELEEQAAQARQALEAARARRTAAWQAIESVGGAA